MHVLSIIHFRNSNTKNILDWTPSSPYPPLKPITALATPYPIEGIYIGNVQSFFTDHRFSYQFLPISGRVLQLNKICWRPGAMHLRRPRFVSKTLLRKRLVIGRYSGLWWMQWWCGGGRCKVLWEEGLECLCEWVKMLKVVNFIGVYRMGSPVPNIDGASFNTLTFRS